MIFNISPDECHMFHHAFQAKPSLPFQNECSLIPSVSASDKFLCLGRGNLKLSLDVTDLFKPSESSHQYSSQIASGFPLGFASIKDGIFKEQ